MTQAPAKALQKSLSKLQIAQDSPIPTVKTKPKVNKTEPAESWEDADDSSDTETESIPIGAADDAPAPPPPTPSSPSMGTLHLAGRSPYGTLPPSGVDSNSSSGANTPSRTAGELRSRPEKSTAVASRLIAAGIGQKAPRRSKEEREYDQAMKVQEKKRRDQAKQEEERQKMEKERAIKSAWMD